MKRIFITIFTILMILDVIAIKPILVKFKCNLKTINIQEGDKRTRWTLNDPDGGWCYIYKSKHPKELVGHNGLLIYKNPYTGEFKVYDLKCPMCDRKKQNTSVQMDQTVTATCPKCGTSYNLCGVGHAVNSMVTDAWLEAYDFRIEGNSIIDKIHEHGKEDYRIEGTRDSNWLLVDMGDVVVNVFTEDARDFYGLEKLWSNGKKLELNLD